MRRREYKRLSGQNRSYIKGQRYTLLSHRKNLDVEGHHALKKLLQANHRLNTAYLLKEVFGQLWDYRTERAVPFLNAGKTVLNGNGWTLTVSLSIWLNHIGMALPPTAIQRTKVSLELVEGVNNKISVLQRRAYGYRDEAYLKLKIIAAFLPPLPKNANINPH